MPYRIRKAPNRDLYWVVGEDGKHHSKDPIPLATAKKQMAALHIAMKGGEYPVPPPRGPMYFDTVEKTAYNQKQADEYKAMDADPRIRDLWNKEQKRYGRTATDKDYAAHRALVAQVTAQRLAFNPTYTPKELAEEKKRDYEQQRFQEDYKNWKKGADAYYAQHPGEQPGFVSPIDEKGNRLSKEEAFSRPKVTKGEVQRRVAAYRENNKSGWQKFGDSIMSFITGITDQAVGVVADVVPGYGKALEVGYKTFAPPGSEFYKEGSVQDKFGNLPENIASAVGAGRKKRRMRGRGWEATKLGASLAGIIGTPMFWIGLGQASPLGPGLIFGAVAQAVLLMGAGYFTDLALRRVQAINQMAAAPGAPQVAPVIVIGNVMRNIQAVIRAYQLPTGPSTGTYSVPPDSTDLVGMPLEAGPAYLVTPLPVARRGAPDPDDFLSPEGAGVQVGFQERQTPVAARPFRGPLIHPGRGGEMTLVPVEIRIEDTVVDVAPAAAAAAAAPDHVAVTVKPEGSGRRRGGMKHLTLDRPPKPGKKPITVAHPEDAAAIVRTPFAQSVSASEIGKYFGKKGVKAATKMTESVYAPHPPDRPPPAPPAGAPPARRRPTIPAAAKPDHDWWVRDELAHDPSGKSLLALRALTTPGIASIVRSFTAPTADVGSHLGPLPMRPATKDEMVHQLWLDAIRREVFSDNDAKEGMARAWYGHYWDMDWDDDHESSEDEGTEINRAAREAERGPRHEAAREERYRVFLDQRVDDLEDIVLTLGREGPHGEPEEPVDPDFWRFAAQDLVRAWNAGAFNRGIKELRFKYSLRPEQAAAVKAGIRVRLEALRDKAAEAESSESSGDEAGDAGRAALGADLERAFAAHTAAEMGSLLSRPAAAAPAAATAGYPPNDMAALRAAAARLEAAEAGGDEREIAAAKRAFDMIAYPELFEGEGRGWGGVVGGSQNP